MCCSSCHLLPVCALVCVLMLAVAEAWADPPNYRTAVCREPAGAWLKVVSNRWPDPSSFAQFAADVFTIENARTDEEKALAIWKWTRRLIVFPEKDPPLDRGGSDLPNPAKLLNVWGVHWCDGQARVMELLLRAAGIEAQKLYKAGHTLCEAYWIDTDGVGRWHLFDVSEHWFARTRDGRWIASSADIARDRSLVYRPSTQPALAHHKSDNLYGWVRAGHLSLNQGGRVPVAMRPGESLLRLWGNVGKPFADAAQQKMEFQYPWELGPYPNTYGNAIWTFDDVTAWSTLEPPVNCRYHEGALRPIDTTQPAELTYRILTPYVISDLELDLVIKGGIAGVELSEDNGGTWRSFDRGEAGLFRLAPPVAEPAKSKGRSTTRPGSTQPASGSRSAFGRYDVRVRIRVPAGAWQVSRLRFSTTAQTNLRSLPQLGPGDNQITVSGELAPGHAIRVTYVWDDPAGRERTNVTVACELPYRYTIRAAGRRWADVRCRSVQMETIPATGQTSRTVVREATSALETLEPEPGYEQMLGRDRLPPLKPLDEYLAVLGKSNVIEELHDALAGVRVIGDARAYDAVRRVAMQNLDSPKLQAIQTMYWLDRKRAIADFLRIVADDEPDIRYKTGKIANVKLREGDVFSVVGQISCFLADEKAAQAAPALCRFLNRPGMWDEPRWAILRSLGPLGDRSSCDTLLAFVRSGNFDTQGLAVASLGQLGDPRAVPLISETFKLATYPPLIAACLRAAGQLDIREAEAQVIRGVSSSDDEFRREAADALGRIGGPDAVTAMETQLKVESFADIRGALERSIKAIRSRR